MARFVKIAATLRWLISWVAYGWREFCRACATEPLLALLFLLSAAMVLVCVWMVGLILYHAPIIILIVLSVFGLIRLGAVWHRRHQ